MLTNHTTQALIKELRAELAAEARATSELLARAEQLISSRSTGGQGDAELASRLAAVQKQLQARANESEMAAARAASLETEIARLRVSEPWQPACMHTHTHTV